MIRIFYFPLWQMLHRMCIDLRDNNGEKNTRKCEMSKHITNDLEKKNKNQQAI